MAAVRDIAERSDEAAVKIPWRLRLKAWWEGYDLEVRYKDKGNKPARDPAVEEIPPFERWSDIHLELLQAVWGEGCIGPGDEEHILQLVKPFGLNSAMSLLDLGAGLGGPTRLMAKTFGVWASGMESIEPLAKAGMALSTKAGLEKKASIGGFDPERFEGRAKSYDCIFSKERFFTIEDKDRLFKTTESMLKDGGQLLFTDFVLPKKGHKSRDLDKWAAGEPLRPHLWSVDDYKQALTANKLEVRVTEDMTEEYRRGVTQGWAAFLSDKGGAALDKRLAPTLVEEVDLWTRRASVLENGDLQVYRIYALKKSGDKLLSDW